MTKILGIICIAGSIVLGIAMFKQSSNNSNGSSSNRGNPVTRHSAPVVLLGIGLRLLFNGGSAGSISLSGPKRSGGRDISAGLPGHPSMRGGQNTFATNPARLDLNFAHWLAANPRHIVFNAIVAGTGLILLLIKWQVGLALLIVTGIVLYRTRKDMRGKFLRGDVCPGVVLSAETGLVAVLTDLKAATNVARPAIKILKQPLRQIKVYALQDGMRVAAVAEYYGDVQQTTWKNFFPEAIPCVVHDAAENQRILDSIPEAQWQALDQAIAQLPASHPGLYRLWGGNLAVDASAAIPWLQRKWVRLGLITFAGFGLFIILMGAWADRSKAQREQQALLNQSRPSAANEPLAPEPRARNIIELNGQVLTFTNTMGLVLKEVALLRANPGTLTYQSQGREQTMPLALVPVDVQTTLGIPEHWHGYRAALNASQSPAPPVRDTPPPSNGRSTASTGAYQPGQKIYARWAGNWISGTVIEPFGMGMSYRVQLSDPRFRTPIVLSTNLLRPQ